MLFNSSIFLFSFLPLTLAGYFLIRKVFGQKISYLWLLLASLFFYGWWNPFYVPLIALLSVFNFILGRALFYKQNKALLILGLTVDIAALAYYKYTGFMIVNINSLTDAALYVPTIVLPLGISFFTFQKIAYLVDSYKRKTLKRQSWVDFGLFVTFFPQLIAGPITHHKEMMPQFQHNSRFSLFNLTAGLSMLTIGLFKKVIIADYLSDYANPLFKAAAEGRHLHIIEAWVAVLSYTFQIYFDFSGYTDMALGIAKMFGIRLPVNFFSPYKSQSIIDFWRRWHMTLSRFLRDYVYIPLGGNRHGEYRRYVNLLLTMLLGGFWHGAQWGFVIWGALHGTYLVINHLWRKLPLSRPVPFAKSVYGFMTFIAVAVAWIFFRADSPSTALSVITSLADWETMKTSLYNALFSRQSPLRLTFAPQQANLALPVLLFCTVVCRHFPNSIEIMRLARPCIGAARNMRLGRGFAERFVWNPGFYWGLVIGTLMCTALIKVIDKPSHVFLYFQF